MHTRLSVEHDAQIRSALDQSSVYVVAMPIRGQTFYFWVDKPDLWSDVIIAGYSCGTPIATDKLPGNVAGNSRNKP